MFLKYINNNNNNDNNNNDNNNNNNNDDNMIDRIIKFYQVLSRLYTVVYGESLLIRRRSYSL